jgi:hypothetical protein
MNADNRQQIVIAEMQISLLIRTAEISINSKGGDVDAQHGR